MGIVRCMNQPLKKTMACLFRSLALPFSQRKHRPEPQNQPPIAQAPHSIPIFQPFFQPPCPRYLIPIMMRRMHRRLDRPDRDTIPRPIMAKPAAARSLPLTRLASADRVTGYCGVGFPAVAVLFYSLSVSGDFFGVWWGLGKGMEDGSWGDRVRDLHEWYRAIQD